MLEREYFMGMAHRLRALARVAVVIGLIGSAFSGCKREEDEFLLVVPDGAPALALAELMHEDVEGDGMSYRVVDAATVATRVTNKNADENADFCVLPITAASKLLGKGTEYKMLGLLTQGNLYLVSKKFKTQPITQANIRSLYGKTVGVLKMNEVPGLTLRATLSRLDAAYQVLDGGASEQANALNLRAVDAKGIDGSLDYYLVAEPQASKLVKAGFEIVGDLQALYGGGYPQAALVVKTQVLKENGAFVKAFTAKVAGAGAWLEIASAAEIYAAVTSHFDDETRTPLFSVETLGLETLVRCGVRFSYAWECKARVGEFLSEMIAVNKKSAAIPLDGFYQTEWTD